MTDVFALAGRMATTIFERAKQVILWFQANLADPRISLPHFSAHCMLERRAGHAVARLTCHCRVSKTNC